MYLVGRPRISFCAVVSALITKLFAMPLLFGLLTAVVQAMLPERGELRLCSAVSTRTLMSGGFPCSRHHVGA